MKGDIRLKVLEKLAEAPAAFADLLIIFTSPYGSSHSQVQKRLASHHRARERARIVSAPRRQLHNVIYLLKKQNLIRDPEKGDSFNLTSRGRVYLARLRSKKRIALPDNHYTVQKTSEIKIVVFDIPEREKRKREWVRVALRRIGFRIVQKSVWAGKVSIPEDFIKQLNALHLLPYVKILAVTKTGNLESMV